MNNKQSVIVEGATDRDALRLLLDVPNVIVAPNRPDAGPGVVLSAGASTRVTIELTSRRAVNAAFARQLADQAGAGAADAHLVVVAESSTAEARQILDDAGVGLMDAAGNIRINLPGLVIWTEGGPGRVSSADRSLPVKLTGKAGVATQALLGDPDREWRIGDLANAAHVSAGLAHRVVARLEREELLTARGSGPRRTRHLANPSALLDLFAEEVHDRGVEEVRGYRLARDTRSQSVAVSRTLQAAGVDHAITGAAGAIALAPFVTAVPVTDIWVSELFDLDGLLSQLGADPAPTGHNLRLRRVRDDAPLAFRRLVDEAWFTNPFRLYVDLRNDPRRGREQADRLRHEVIGF